MENTQNAEAGRIYGSLGAVASRLVEVLRNGKIDDVLTDESLTAICRKDTRSGGDGYPSLGSAIRYCRNHFGIVWKRIPKANAVKCMSDKERADMVSDGIVKIRRASKRTIEVGKTVKLDNLATNERNTLVANLAQAGAIKMMSSGDTHKKLTTRNATCFSKDKLLAAFEQQPDSPISQTQPQSTQSTK